MIFDKLSKKVGVKLATLTAVFTVSLAAVLILVCVKLLPTLYTRLDLSANSMYTLSEETEGLISDINEDVTVYLISEAGEENAGIRTFLERYACKSKHITVKSLDAEKDAEEIYKYSGSTPPSNSIVVKTEKRYKLIPYYDLFYFGEDAYGYAYQSYAQYRSAGYLSNVTFMEYMKNYAVYDGCYSGYEYEARVNSAIKYVTSDSLKKVYLLAGHDEDAPSFDVYNQISEYGVDLTRINADKVDIPSDTDLLLLFPNIDITENEKQRLSEYMKNGGRVLLVTSYGLENERLMSLLSEYGLESDGKYLCEDNENYNYGGTPHYTVPDISDVGLADVLEKQAGSILLAGTTGITLKESCPEGINFKPLLTASPESYTTSDVNNYKFDAEKDTRGVRYTGISATNENGGGVVWISAPSVLYEEYNIYTNGGNLSVLMYYINELTENAYDEPAPTVALSSLRITVPRPFMYTFAIILCGVLPLGLTGFAFYRRKRLS